jgi:hypothetical protein
MAGLTAQAVPAKETAAARKMFRIFTAKMLQAACRA